MENKKICFKCLLEDLDESEIFKSVKEMIDAIPEENRTVPDEYHRRLEICRACESLISGTCVKCGCYVELRARLKNQDCPDVDNKRW